MNKNRIGFVECMALWEGLAIKGTGAPRKTLPPMSRDLVQLKGGGGGTPDQPSDGGNPRDQASEPSFCGWTACE